MAGMSSSPDSELRRRGPGELILIGMGLWDHNGLSLSGVKATKSADEVYAELYTNIMPGLNLKMFERTIGKEITILRRRDLEEDADKGILRIAQKKRVVLLVPGDPLAATTHVALRLRAYELGISTRVVHAASVFSAAPSLVGLQHYKFGKKVTMPIPQEGYLPLSPYDVVSENLSRGLHTLLLLDIDVERGRYLSINEALKLLLKMETIKRTNLFTDDRLVIGLARIGSPKPTIRCDYINVLAGSDFGPPPHTLIVPGDLHFMEANTLVKLFGAPPSIMPKRLTSEQH
nr:diphthine synthase [Candidatus Njordarchaeota archaeon]